MPSEQMDQPFCMQTSYQNINPSKSKLIINTALSLCSKFVIETTTGKRTTIQISFLNRSWEFPFSTRR